MKRRNFFKKAGLLGLGSTLLHPENLLAQPLNQSDFSNSKAKNIIFLVSDGMSNGTLNMADIFLQRTTGKGSNWLNLYRENKVNRALMDMASASSTVTDSAAASSSWGGGNRVKNGRVNIGDNGEKHKPIWQKFKEAGKMAGCVTTVPITHATPAGFTANSESRKDMEGIAETQLQHKFDVLMGGGQDIFSPDKRKDGKDMYQAFEKAGYTVVKDKTAMQNASTKKPLLGVFSEDGLPYSLDYLHDDTLKSKIPTLAEMTAKAIAVMKNSPNGFVLQVEGGKVDWAAHANCTGGLIYDQVAFDQALKVALDFANADKNTLVIITTDHGNSNPGLLYGKDANNNFDRIQQFKHTNEWILNGITPDQSINQIIERIEYANGFAITRNQAFEILGYYNGLEKQDDGLYNYKKLPYKLLANIQKDYTNVGWIGDNHSADYVELAMYGAGSMALPAFVKNTDLHWYMLTATGVKH
ncbi:MAG: alkaline phosphatase [Flavobacteriaceae bacterium]